MPVANNAPSAARTAEVCRKPATKLLRRQEASEYLRENWGLSYTTGTLAKMASNGNGPPSIRGPMRSPFYRPR